MKFQKYDEINHPTYGRGIVKKVIDPQAVCPILEVQFDKDGLRKKLNAKWVLENCVCYTTMSDEDLAKKYTPVLIPNFPDWHMEVAQGVVISEHMKSKLYYLLENTIPGIGFAVIGEDSAVAFFPDEDKGYKSIEKIARRYMSTVFSKHPDFSVTLLDDNGAVIFMNEDRLICYFRPEDTVIENGKLSGQTMFSAREHILESCSKKNIIAIVKGY